MNAEILDNSASCFNESIFYCKTWYERIQDYNVLWF